MHSVIKRYFSAIAAVSAICVTAQAQRTGVKVQTGPSSRQAAPAARTAQAPARPPQQPPAPPKGFELTAAQQQELDQLLDAWEQAGKAIENFEVQFRRLEYTNLPPNAPPGAKPAPPVESTGEIKYKAPDKGLYVARDDKGVEVDRWVTDGKTIYEFRPDPKEPMVVAHHLPPELQGKGIVDGPLPFLFGTEAAKLKARYWIRVVNLEKAPDQVMLEVKPRFMEDARNYEKAQVILRRKDLSMVGLQVFYPGGRIRKVHSFGEASINQSGALAILQKDFSKPSIPFGWKLLEDPAPGAGAPAQQPAGNPANNARAPQTRPANVRR